MDNRIRSVLYIDKHSLYANTCLSGDVWSVDLFCLWSFESWIVAVIAFLGAAAFHGPQFSKLKYDD